MRFARTSKVVGALAISALALTACGGGDNSGSTSGNNADGDPTAIITAYGGEPQRPLIPADTGEVFGGRVVDQLFQGLFSYDNEGAPINEVAESIESDDQQTYTITIKGDTQFTNGEPVTAQTFVDTWNFAANATNNLSNAYFFESIEGYADVSRTKVDGQTAEGEDNVVPDPAAETMSGLEVVDDTTFTVTLTQAEADFPLRLGYSAYYPLPSAAIADPEAYGENPVGNGPYKMATETGAWQHDKQIDLIKNEDYSGPREAQNGGITFTFYTDPAAAYADIQSDNLDVLDVIPSANLRTYTTDLPDRNLNKPYAGNATLNIPSYVDGFGFDEEGLLRREALSYAINRQEVTDVVYQGTRFPAKDFTAPSLNGYKEDIPGSEKLNFDVDKANELWDQANEINPWDESRNLTLGYNTDGGNKEWIDAVANQLRTNLSINAEGKAYPQFASMLDDRMNKNLDGLVRAGWQGDYPSLYNFLGPLLATGASSNYEEYSNPEFDQLLKDGLGAPSVDEANAKFNEAQEILFEELPNLPLWSNAVQVGWSSTVQNVDTDWRGVVQYNNITKTS